MFSNKGQCSTRFLVPFFTDSMQEICSQNKFEKAGLTVRYLSKFVDELFHDDDTGICSKYFLRAEDYEKYGFPTRFMDVKMLSSMPQVQGDYTFRMSKVELYAFNTGLGFLELEITYADSALKDISNISYCIANAFNNEHDNSSRDNRLEFSYGPDGKSFSLKNAILSVLETQKCEIELFPNSSRKRMVVYHNLIQNASGFDSKFIDRLKLVLPGGADVSSDGDGFDYTPTPNQLFGISSNGVVCVGLKTKANADFICDVHRKNVYSDYYIAYILALYEREILLKYNQTVVGNYSNPTVLVKMRPSILKLEILFSYNTVSTERAYQDFYSKVYDAMNLGNLEEDISAIVNKVDEYVSEKKDRKTNVLLTIVALLALISVITDSFGIADRIYSDEPLGFVHYALLLLIALSVIVGFFLALRKKK